MPLSEISPCSRRPIDRNCSRRSGATCSSRDPDPMPAARTRAVPRDATHRTSSERMRRSVSLCRLARLRASAAPGPTPQPLPSSQSTEHSCRPPVGVEGLAAVLTPPSTDGTLRQSNDLVSGCFPLGRVSTRAVRRRVALIPRRSPSTRAGLPGRSLFRPDIRG
jgi:hypothetical protein